MEIEGKYSNLKQILGEKEYDYFHQSSKNILIMKVHKIQQSTFYKFFQEQASSLFQHKSKENERGCTFTYNYFPWFLLLHVERKLVLKTGRNQMSKRYNKQYECIQKVLQEI